MSRLADGVVRRLRDDIVSGRHPPGARLTEAELSAEFAVSRVPVREALRHLEAEGFVESRAYAGVTVARFSPDEAEDLYAVRRTLEETTARRAATRWRDTPEEVTGLGEELAAIVASGREALRSDTELLPALNTAFHRCVAELAGSTTLVALLRQVASKIEWLYAMDVADRGPHSWSEHAAIADAVLGGDAEAARRLMGEHVQASLDGYLLRHAGCGVAAAAAQTRSR